MAMETETLFESILRLFSWRTTQGQYLPRLLPEIKVSPLPEDIFLATIKALVVPAASLSLPQWGTLGLLILLTNTSPALRKTTLKLYGYLSLIIGAEIAMINAYVLVCSYISPSTTLRPVTVVALNVLNSLVPVFTDSLVLIRLIKEKVSHSDSMVNIVSTMGTPILLKFMRLVNAVMSIQANTEFIVISLTVEKGDVTPNTNILETLQTWNIYMSSGLHLVDNLCSFGVHWMHIIKMRKLTASASPLSTMNFSNLIVSFGSQYILSILLNAAQLAVTSYVPSAAGNTTMLIDSTKVVINIICASVATLRKNTADLPTSGALLRKAESVTRDVLKIPVPPVTTSDPSGVAAPGGKPISTVDSASGGLTDSVPGGWEFTSQSDHSW